MFCAKEFAVGANVMPSSGFAVAVIVVINIAARIAALKLVESNVELQTVAIETRPKEDLINGIASEPIAGGWLQFPLWIKVPQRFSPLPASSRRPFSR
jgi:hypothetical protein